MATVPLLAVARWMLSLPGLSLVFVVFTVLAAWPLQRVDVALYQPWSEWLLPTWRPFIQNVIDHIAGQIVAVPMLGVLALTLAWRRRSWRPILTGLAVECGYLGIIGGMKLVFARRAPVLQEPSFFAGGVLEHGWHGMSYPSGHASEAVLFYGAAVFLLVRYTSLSHRIIVATGCGASLVTPLAIFTSLYLGWHWWSDLVGGALAGAVVLRLVMWLDGVLPRWLSRLVDRKPPGQGLRATAPTNRSGLGVSSPSGPSGHHSRNGTTPGSISSSPGSSLATSAAVRGVNPGTDSR